MSGGASEMRVPAWVMFAVCAAVVCGLEHVLLLLPEPSFRYWRTPGRYHHDVLVGLIRLAVQFTRVPSVAVVHSSWPASLIVAPFLGNLVGAVRACRAVPVAIHGPSKTKWAVVPAKGGYQLGRRYACCCYVWPGKRVLDEHMTDRDCNR